MAGETTQTEFDAAKAPEALKEMWELFRAGRYDESFKIALAVANATHHADAEYALGNHYNGGAGVEKDPVEGLRWHRLAAEKGHEMAEFSMGLALTVGLGTAVDHGGAVSWFRKAAAQGNALAQTSLGRCYENGQGVGQDPAEATYWYRLGAEQGFHLAQINLSRAYEYGIGVEKDLKESINWLRKAAELGEATAQLRLGRCYAKGYGVEQDAAEARSWLARAAAQDDPDAMADLGFLYLGGEGGAQDTAEAVRMFRAAAATGNAHGEWNLGLLHEQGRGVPLDPKEATACFERAAAKGHADAVARLAKDMTPPQPPQGARRPWRLYLLRLVVLGALGGLAWGAWYIGFWFALFWAYVLMVLQVALTRCLGVLVSPDALTSIAKEFRSGEYLMSLRTSVATLFVTLAFAIFWPLTLVVRLQAVIAFQKEKRNTSLREIGKHARTNSVMLEVWFASYAACVAVFLTVFTLPDAVELYTAAIVAASCTLFLSALALVPNGLAERLRTSTDFALSNLLALAALFYVALVLVYWRLDSSLNGAGAGTALLTTTKALLLPGRDWLWPWLAARADDLTDARFHLVNYLPAPKGPKPTYLQVAEFFSGTMFWTSVVMIVLDRKILKRNRKDVLEYVNDLLRLQRFERAASLLNGVDTEERNFRWWLGRALCELGQRKDGNRALECAETAAKIHYTHFSLKEHSPEGLLYSLAIDFELPDAAFVDRLTQWIVSERCKDEDLWRVACAAIIRQRSHIIAVVAMHVSREHLPLTRALLACHEKRADESITILDQFEVHGDESEFACLFTRFLALRSSLAARAFEAWVKDHAAEIERVMRLQRNEYMVRMALDWVTRIPDASFTTERKMLEQALYDQYADAPGLVTPSFLRARVVASRFSEKIMRRWPSLRELSMQL